MMYQSFHRILFISTLSLGLLSNTKGPNQQDNSAKFLSLFPTIPPLHLHVYSPAPYYDSVRGKEFMGKKLDSTFYGYFSSQSWSPQSNHYIYACYKFPLSNNRIGLIVRCPSQYDESAIDLCIWDNSLKKIINSFELADSFGDGGWEFVKDAWLEDINKTGELNIITRKQDNWIEENDSPSKKSTTDSLKIYLIKNDYYIPTIVTVDTNKFKLHDWNH